MHTVYSHSNIQTDYRPILSRKGLIKYPTDNFIGSDNAICRLLSLAQQISSSLVYLKLGLYWCVIALYLTQQGHSLNVK